MDVYRELEELCAGLTDHTNIEIEYRNRDEMKNALGRTYFFDSESDGHICMILLNSKIACTECMQSGVLWHEICHCVPWINNGRTEGHSSAFYVRLWSKPIHAFYSLCAEYWFGLLDAFN